MTIVDISPTPAPPQRRAMLPRNPTPWTAPGNNPPLPPQVQRLLGDGAPYRTYQPFQIGLPLILPENNPVPSFQNKDIFTAESETRVTVSSTKCFSVTNNQPMATTNLATTENRENIINQAPRHQQNVLNNNNSDNNIDNSTSQQQSSTTTAATTAPENNTSTSVPSPPSSLSRYLPHTTSPPPLTELCRRALVSHQGLRGLRQLLLQLKAPRCLARFLCTLDARECTVRSSAPLLDVFAEPFFHRAVTWRVVCSLDRQPYLATYGHTAAEQECAWESAGGGAVAGGECGGWLWCDHPHVMRVWGLVLDHVTGNTFYLLDTPIATLQQIQLRLSQRLVVVPESVVWACVYSVASALNHTATRGLQYAPLQLANVFLLPQQVVIENGLTRKKLLGEGGGCSAPHTPLGGCCVHQVGRLLFALTTCHLGPTDGVSYVHLLHLLREQYSSALLRLLSRTLCGGLAKAWADASPSRGTTTTNMNKSTISSTANYRATTADWDQSTTSSIPDNHATNHSYSRASLRTYGYHATNHNEIFSERNSNNSKTIQSNGIESIIELCDNRNNSVANQSNVKILNRTISGKKTTVRNNISDLSSIEDCDKYVSYSIRKINSDTNTLDDFSKDLSTRPKSSISKDHKQFPDKRTKKRYRNMKKSSSSANRLKDLTIAKENVSPNISKPNNGIINPNNMNSNNQRGYSNQSERSTVAAPTSTTIKSRKIPDISYLTDGDIGYPYSDKYYLNAQPDILNSSASTASSTLPREQEERTISLDAIVHLASAHICQGRDGNYLQEQIRCCPQRLVQLALSGQS